MRNILLFAGLSVSILASACGDDTTDGTGASSSGASGGTGPTTSSGGTGGTTTTTSAGGTGGTGGVTDGGAGGGTGGSGGSGGEAPAPAHLVISEVGVAPVAAEFIEIYNPTAAAVDLTNYYISDNSTYTTVAAGQPWAPITNNAGTDFAARFPAGTSIAAGAVLTIGFDAGYFTAFAKCPDFYVGTAALPCGIASTPAMLAASTGSITDNAGLSDSREMLVLFTWSGNTAEPLKDVDYVTWGATFENGTRVDKTGIAGYVADTAPAMQRGAPEPQTIESLERCQFETGETLTGGNGLTGHDETSEDFGATFALQMTATPGVKNTCL